MRFACHLSLREVILFMKTTETFSARDRDEFRQWLVEHHETSKEVWLVIYKKASGEESITYDEAVEEALCFGWTANLMKSLKRSMFIQRFAPRRKGSDWTLSNETSARKMIQEGRMTKAGRDVLPWDFVA
jgi:uncharacterized protein YdeI (YjbR/CyaY-like superfamily)